MLTKNIDRACRAYGLLDGYPDFHHRPDMPAPYSEEDAKECFADEEAVNIVTDIMHLCELTGCDFEAVLRMARFNYEAERDGTEE